MLAAGLAMPAQAQGRPATVCRLPVHDVGTGDAATQKQRPSRPTCPTPSAFFEVTYDGFPAEAERAFEAAVETWSCRIDSPVPIQIDARWEPLGAAVLGSAGPFLTRNFAGAPARDTWYASALADALAGRDLGGGADIEASFNSTFSSWHLDPDTAPSADEYDLYTVVLHELGHGLGFIGNLTVEDGLGFVGAPGETEGAFVYDRFARVPGGGALLDLGDGTRDLADALQSAVLFDGQATRSATGGPLALYAPGRWEPGGSYSHLAESDFGRGTPDGLMTPFIGRGETIDVPGTATCALLADTGWPLAGDCAARVGAVAPPGASLQVRLRGPNPVRAETLRLEVSAAVPQTGRVTLVDALGRRVAELYAGPLGPDAEPLRLETRALAAGVYQVVAEAAGEVRRQPVTVVR